MTTRLYTHSNSFCKNATYVHACVQAGGDLAQPPKKNKKNNKKDPGISKEGQGSAGHINQVGDADDLDALPSLPQPTGSKRVSVHGCELCGDLVCVFREQVILQGGGWSAAA